MEDNVFKKAVKAGRRTYFFDVKRMRDGQLYISVTESKRTRHDDGSVTYEKHKLFLYSEDFIKFSDALKEVIEYVRAHNPTPVQEIYPAGEESVGEATE
ncbi:MAG: PUR family DNA/RNA-binding protein [Flavobacteriales bacterium]|nr:PUR family DNA/RNA-binding protein [Flavobacteriales bacterium]MCX7768845.1 PUR family DNA/RNA-binding protein [Flavobacteriales bacterium]MDW8410515.1 DUF3276 family protein [Flavobacteriales bacterium]